MTPRRHRTATFDYSRALEIVSTREFDAPMGLVFDVMTKPEHLRQTFAPYDETVTVCEVDLRAGGEYHIVFVTKEGQAMSFRGTYLEVDPPTHLVSTWHYEGWPDAPAVETMDLSESGGVTTMSYRLAFADQAGRDRMFTTDGVESTWDNVETYLWSLLDAGGAP